MKTLVALLLGLAAMLTPAKAAERPNIVLIISDDHAHTDYGFMGNAAVRTPHLDRMAAQSLLYPRGYVMPVCSPSLASLLTGRLPHQHGITGNDLSGAARAERGALADKLLANPFILPKALSDSGYLTFQSGKLWNTTYRQVGFTHGMTDTAGRHGDAGLSIGRKGLKPMLDFIDEATAAKKPFFVWYAPLLPHDPHNPPERLLKKYRGKGPTPDAEKYHAMVEWFDETCGELDAHLAQRGLTDETIVLYLADNGWDGARGYKGKRAKLTPYETGIRTPIFIRWPGKVDAQRDDRTLASIIDIVPTILKHAGIPVPADMPGIDLADLPAMRKREAVFVESYTHDIADLTAPEKSLLAHVVIRGSHKLLLPGDAMPDRPFSTKPSGPELFDLQADPGETRNLAAEKPDLVREMSLLLQSNWKKP
ncbi:MAG: sulfatase-like hydrolase/transferase [Akkermansiaceae bacterium]|jgi:uncharacterized sulfatase|nr:sulfatase-like hydrolase/transferase [Akkermansiaceae bacterium]